MEHSLYKTVLELQRLLVMRKLNPRRAAGEELVAAERAEAGTGYESLRGEISCFAAKRRFAE